MNFKRWFLWRWKDLPHDARVKVTVYFRRPTLTKEGYISAYHGSAKEFGENWNRGSDLSDGKWNQATVDRIKQDLDKVFIEQCNLQLKDRQETFNSFFVLIKSFFK